MTKIIIADSGSTKTDWRISDFKKKVIEEQQITDGINPYFMSSEEILKSLKQTWKASVNLRQVEHIFFYGAGCSSVTKCNTVHQGLSEFFPQARVEVHHDLLAAARALFGDDDGIAGILGTGSNSCLFSEGEIKENIFSLGYFFGDEGSGAHIGKTVVRAFLKQEMPDELSEKFKFEFGLSKEQILDNVYNKPNPNRFLAQFARFAGENISSAFLHQIVKDCFRQHFEYQITRYSNYRKYPLRFVGSVAFHFQGVLSEVAREYKISVDRIIKNPAEDLVQYHMNQFS